MVLADEEEADAEAAAPQSATADAAAAAAAVARRSSKNLAVPGANVGGGSQRASLSSRRSNSSTGLGGLKDSTQKWDVKRASITSRTDIGNPSQLSMSPSMSIDRRTSRKLVAYFEHNDQPLDEEGLSRLGMNGQAGQASEDWASRRVAASRRASMLHQDKVQRRLSRASISTPGTSRRPSSAAGRRPSSAPRRASTATRRPSSAVARRRSVEYDAEECYQQYSEGLRGADALEGDVVQVPRGKYDFHIEEISQVGLDIYNALFVRDDTPIRRKPLTSTREQVKIKLTRKLGATIRAGVHAAMAADEEGCSQRVKAVVKSILETISKFEKMFNVNAYILVDEEPHHFGQLKDGAVQDEVLAIEAVVDKHVRDTAEAANNALDARRLPELLKHMRKLSNTATRIELVVDTMAFIPAGVGAKARQTLLVMDPSIIGYSLVDAAANDTTPNPSSAPRTQWQHRLIALKEGKTTMKHVGTNKIYRVVVKTLEQHNEDSEHKRLRALGQAAKHASWWKEFKADHNPAEGRVWKTMDPQQQELAQQKKARLRRRASVDEKDWFEIMTPLLTAEGTAGAAAEEWARGAVDYAVLWNWPTDDWLGPKTPLRTCVYHGQKALVEALLQSRADANEASEPQLVSVLHLATWLGGREVCSLLLDYGAEPNCVDALGQTPIFFAPDAEVCKLLVERRADLGHENERKQTPLHLACRAGLTGCIEEMMKRKEELARRRDVYGAQAFYYAQQAGLPSKFIADVGLKQSPSI
eukprot:TRINITY_DN21269_c0_g3_i1.p1 TRINITY_DN21269_c0_g3~~TRINITY_DN21269_c0_g3_i1.p1  ORF type:complete len:782 (+),score=191.08 TRINITY_DN21269_c0_g3_i1:78-2348(+)